MPITIAREVGLADGEERLTIRQNGRYDPADLEGHNKDAEKSNSRKGRPCEEQDHQEVQEEGVSHETDIGVSPAGQSVTNGTLPSTECSQSTFEVIKADEVIRRAEKRELESVDSIQLLKNSKRSLSITGETSTAKTLKLSREKIIALATSPDSLPLSPASENLNFRLLDGEDLAAEPLEKSSAKANHTEDTRARNKDKREILTEESKFNREKPTKPPITPWSRYSERLQRPTSNSRTISTPSLRRRASSRGDGSNRDASASHYKSSKSSGHPLHIQEIETSGRRSEIEDPQPSPMPSSIPLPPLSFPTYLQLELSSQRPSPLYIHRSVTSDFPYESSKVKIERLLNFVFLPPRLEHVLWFGALACLDAWLFAFTILPLRFLKALSILVTSWANNIRSEASFLIAFTYVGLGRMWRRRRRASGAGATLPKSPNGHTSDPDTDKAFVPLQHPVQNHDPRSIGRNVSNQRRNSSFRRHRRNKSTPSALLPDHKADLLKGLLILLTCSILMYFDASRMYHGIRGQAAIKLYVIYNVLEVCDRLFSALGQDVLECLFSKETLERKPNGRSKLLRPFWLFILALAYTLIHATSLFYQVITLNVAVNSYSNALLTLLMSNQFVEIKSTVFKKIEKENLFQLTCADVVERFQLWLMLTIIASRNIIETGGLSIHRSSASDTASVASAADTGILPKSFTLVPYLTGQVFGPFLLVLGSEMLVDWLKHAYITKFNNTKPAIYGRFLDVLAKDYYSNAFADQNLTKRLGLPVIPLACLFIRASVQNYYMFLETHMPLPSPSLSTSLTVSYDLPTSSPTLDSGSPLAINFSLDSLIRRALGRSTPSSSSSYQSAIPMSFLPFSIPKIFNFDFSFDIDTLLTKLTTALFFLLIYLVLLLFKLILGMFLLRFARHRYRGMKERENESVNADGGKRFGGWGVVEVDEEKKRWIYADDPEGWKRSKEREGRESANAGARVGSGGGGGEGELRGRSGAEKAFEGVERYAMVGKRIW